MMQRLHRMSLHKQPDTGHMTHTQALVRRKHEFSARAAYQRPPHRISLLILLCFSCFSEGGANFLGYAKLALTRPFCLEKE